MPEFPTKFATADYIKAIEPEVTDFRNTDKMFENLPEPIKTEIEGYRKRIEIARETVWQGSPGEGKHNRVLIKGTDDPNVWKCAIKVDKPGCDAKSNLEEITGVSAEDLEKVFLGNEANPDLWENQGNPTWEMSVEIGEHAVEEERKGATLHLTRRLYIPANQTDKYLEWTLKHTTIEMPDPEKGFEGKFEVDDTLKYIGG